MTLAPILSLAPEVAERIAAGEVIERPASVVRELLDNAIDAGASEVSIELRGGGLELIRVADDGSGIPADQVELAFQRHATSKLRAVEDLQSLRTLGFRGEALPSIAAVSETTLLTRAEGDPSGTLLVLRGGGRVKRGRAARQRGTTVTVRHLFHNVPARLKFLPAERAEAALVGQLVRRYALAHPHLRLSLALDGRPSFRGGGGTLEAALADVYGPALADALLPLRQVGAGRATLGGFVSGRSVTRPGRQHLTLLVNGRWAASRGLLAGLEAAYRPLLPRGRHPIAAIVLHVPPDELDPNVHPAKTEVKLLKEQELVEALAALIRETLGQAPAHPRDDEEFALGPTQYRLPTPRRWLAEPGAGWDKGQRDPLASIAQLQVRAQVRQTLILAEGPSGLFLVDQHRAHERVIYERLLDRERGGAEGQALLEPLLLELQPHQAEVLEARVPFLEGLGFRCQRFGGREFLVSAVPSPHGGADLGPHLAALLEEAAAPDDAWQGRLLASLACRAAIRRGRTMDAVEMETLLGELAATQAPAVCPHGSALILHFSAAFLERQFDW